MVFDRRCMNAEDYAYALPRDLAADDARFTGRCVARRHVKLWKWLDRLLAAAGTGNAHQVEYIAIRRSKMVAALKPGHQPLNAWLLDLADGSIVPSISLDTIHEIGPE
jgi:hypothetical protein